MFVRRNGLVSNAWGRVRGDVWATHRLLSIGPCSVVGAARAAQLLSAGSLRPCDPGGQTPL